MSDVFVSYKAEDRKRVKPLVEALEADGHSVWWDEQIGGGAAWRHAIEAELNAAKCVIVAWSKRSVGTDGTFVQDEATRAQQRRVYVPVTIDKVHLPLGFGETQALPLIGWRGDRADPRYQSILAAVRRIAGNSPDVSAPPSARQGRLDRRAVVAGTAVAATALAGVGAWALLRSSSAEALDSIAVLPFANLSGDPARAYFSDGVAEELRSALARLGGLRVVGRTSSEAVRNDDAETAARKLDVASILTGSVRQSPSTIRISAQLIDGRNGIERWSQNYDRAPGDAIAIQTDIAEKVADALKVTLGVADKSLLTVGGTHNVEAQNLLFQGTHPTSGDDKDGLLLGIRQIDRAIALDPGYAEAYAQKSILLNVYAAVFANSAEELDEYRARALETAKVAVRLAPNLATTHRALGEIYRVDLRDADSVREFRRALELAPSDAGVNRDFAYVLARLGNAPESMRLSARAIELDPLNRLSYRTRMWTLYGLRNYREGARFAQELEQRSPALFDLFAITGFCLMLLGRYADAERYFNQAKSGDYVRLVGEAVILARTGHRDEVPIKIAELRRLYGDAASYQYAQVYAQLGDKESAFAALSRAWDIRDSGLLNLKMDELLDPLRGDARYAALLDKVGFPA
jgi:serine/threonine-protein kinase